jgi:TonB family protein
MHGDEIVRRITGTGQQDVGIGIEQVGVLVYPPSMTADAVFSGEARAVISVDAEGKLSDWLIIGYTQPAFAEAAAAAIQRWRYNPAVINGRRRASRAHILFEFRTQGVVVQTLPGAMVKQIARPGSDERYVFQPCRLSELDRTPEPEQVVAPAVKLEGAPRSVIVEFYIDEQGRVRMPAVDREAADDVLAAASVAAVEQWRFKPPLRKGRPVLVYAQQVFTFKARE